ncbi:MAG TPA: enoyl-CoA hydratase-related protein, partial [Pseudonocardia sp.]
GQARALQMSLAGTKLDARTAEAWGLVNGVVEHEQLLDTAVDMARAVADLAPEVVARLLGMYREAPDHPTTEALARESLNSRAWLALRNGAEDDQQPSGQTQDTS